jgi:hypothetical protein
VKPSTRGSQYQVCAGSSCLAWPIIPRAYGSAPGSVHPGEFFFDHGQRSGRDGDLLAQPPGLDELGRRPRAVCADARICIRRSVSSRSLTRAALPAIRSLDRSPARARRLRCM